MPIYKKNGNKKENFTQIAETYCILGVNLYNKKQEKIYGIWKRNEIKYQLTTYPDLIHHIYPLQMHIMQHSCCGSGLDPQRMIIHNTSIFSQSL